MIRAVPEKAKTPLETTLDAAEVHPQPGRVPLRPLNRREYANAVCDLIGLDIDAPAFLADAYRSVLQAHVPD